MDKKEEVEIVAKELVKEYEDVIVESLREGELNWAERPYYELGRSVLVHLQSEIPDDILEDHRPVVLQSFCEELQESDRLATEKKSSDDPNDPIQEYGRVIVKGKS